jgi:hypothetical protein
MVIRDREYAVFLRDVTYHYLLATIHFDAQRRS